MNNHKYSDAKQIGKYLGSQVDSDGGITDFFKIEDRIYYGREATLKECNLYLKELGLKQRAKCGCCKTWLDILDNDDEDEPKFCSDKCEDRWMSGN